MKVNELLKELIDEAFRFDNEHQGTGDYTMQDFLGYLNTHPDKKELELRKISGEETEWLEPAYMNPVKDISILLGLMYRYAKGYIKKALKDRAIKTADEFSFRVPWLSTRVGRR